MRTPAPAIRVIGLAVAIFCGLLATAARGDGPQASTNPESSPPAVPLSAPSAPTQPADSGANASSAAPSARPAGSLRQRVRVFFTRRSRQQQPAPPNPTPPRPSQEGAEPAPSAAQPGAGMATEKERLSVPRAERGETGAQPTVAEQVKLAPAPAAAPAAPTPLFLNRLLGLEDAPFRTYGWIENTFTGNANGTPADRSNFSVFPNRLANQWEGNQYYLVVENPLEPDDLVNLGFRIDTLFGNDWQFTRDWGFFPGAFPNNNFAGLDFPQIYGEIHLPILTPGGLDIKGGRFYSPAGYSAVPAISRPFISVPYSLNDTPFTFFGVLATLHLTDRINVYSGTTNGWDRWIDESFRWGYLGFVTWKTRDDKTDVVFIGDWGPDQLPRFAAADAPYVPTATTPPSAALAGKVNPYYASSWRNFYSLVITHQWSDKLLEVAETDHVYDPKIIGFSTNGQPSSIYYAGLVHWFLYTFTEKVSGGWRGEIFWDPYGAATGSRSTFFEQSLVLTFKPKPWLWLRTEARYDWSQFTHPFSDGTRSSQLTLAVATYLLF
jgi:hypothetical protein